MKRVLAFGLACGLLMAFAPATLVASTYYWDSPTLPGALWSSSTNWWTTSGGSTNGGPPTSADTAVFNGSGQGGATVVQVSGAAVAFGLAFANTGSTTIESASSGTATLTLSQNGTFIIPSGNGAITFGDSTGAFPLNIVSNLGESFVNSSSNLLTIANNWAITNNSGLSGSGPITVLGVISGGPSSKTFGTGSGLVLFTGNNTFSQATMITGGTLQLGNGGTTGSIGGVVSLADNGTLLVDRADNVTATLWNSNGITGVGSLVQAGSGTLMLGVSNSYTGGTTINAGVLQVGNSAALGTGILTLAAGEFSSNGATAYSLPNALSLAGTASLGDPTNNGALTFTAASGTLATNSLLTISSPVTINSGLTGSGFGLTKAGTGLLTLAGSNTFSGGTTISLGTVEFANTNAMPSSGTVSVNSGATLAVPLGGSGQYTTAASGSGSLGALLSGTGGLGGAVTWNSGAILGIDTTGANVTYAGAISNPGGSLGLTLFGGKQLTLTGSSNYSGVTTISAGTLAIDSGGTLGSIGATSAVVNNGTLVVNRSDSVTTALWNSQSISGSGGLVQLGTGVLTLDVPNTFTGPVLVSAGTLAIANNLALQNVTFNSSHTGVFILSGSATSPTFAGLTGSTNLATAFASGYGNVTGLTFNPASGTVDSYSGVIADGQAGTTVTMNGPGTQIFSASNTYTGSTTLTGGTLQVGNSSALGTGSLALVGGELSSSGTTAYSLSNPLILSGSAALGDPTNNGGLTFTAASGTLAANSQLTVNSPVTINNGLSDFGGGSGLTKAGTGSLTLTGSSTYGGGTTISAGTLAIGSGGTQGSIGSTSAVVDNGTLVVNRSDSVTTALWNSQSISGSGGLVQLGTGVLTLGVSNAYTGVTLVSAGTLALANTGALSGSTFNNAGAGLLSFGTLTSATFGGLQGTSGTLALNNVAATPAGVALSVGNNGGTTTFGGVLSGSGSLAQLGGMLTLSGSNLYTGTTTIGGGTLVIGGSGNLTGGAYTPAINNSGLLIYSSVASQTFSGLISGAGSLAISAGNVALTGTNTYSGATTLTGGALVLGNNSAVGSGLLVLGGGTLQASAALSLANSAQETGNFTFAGSNSITFTSPFTNSAANHTISNVMTAGTLTLGNIYLSDSSSAGHTLAIAIPNIATTTNVLLSGTISDYNGLSGSAGSLALAVGKGSITISGSNTYSGMTTFTGANGGPVIVNNNAAFGTSLLNFDKANIQAGTGPVTLTNAVIFTNPGNGSNIVVGSGGFAFTFAGTVTNSAGNATGLQNNSNGLLTLSNNVLLSSSSAAGTLNFIGGSSGPILVSGPITNWSGSGGTGNLTFSGPNVLTLTGSNSYSGNTTINGGTLSFANGSLGTGPIIFGAGILQWNGANTQDISAQISSSVAQTAALDTQSNNVTFATALSGTTSLTKYGSGMLTLAASSALANLTVGVNSTAGLYVNGGTVAIAGGGSLSVGSGSASSIIIGSATSSGNASGTVDLSAGSGFTASIGTLTIGSYTNATVASGGGTSFGLLRLSAGSSTVNNITATTSVIVGNGTGFAIGVSTLDLGGGTTNLQTPLVQIGLGKGSGVAGGGK